jgi:hypothetical protein
VNEDKPPFDTVRAAFFLVAGVISVQCIILMYSVVFCSFFSTGERCEGLRGSLTELLTAALAAALAFAGGMTRK